MILFWLFPHNTSGALVLFIAEKMQLLYHFYSLELRLSSFHYRACPDRFE